MSESTDTTRPGWCHYHQGEADDVALVNIIETGSGPGGMLYACATCRTERRLTPLLDGGR